MSTVPKGFRLMHSGVPVRSFRNAPCGFHDYEAWMQGAFQIPVPGGRTKVKESKGSVLSSPRNKKATPEQTMSYKAPPRGEVIGGLVNKKGVHA